MTQGFWRLYKSKVLQTLGSEEPEDEFKEEVEASWVPCSGPPPPSAALLGFPPVQAGLCLGTNKPQSRWLEASGIGVGGEGGGSAHLDGHRPYEASPGHKGCVPGAWGRTAGGPLPGALLQVRVLGRAMGRDPAPVPN